MKVKSLFTALLVMTTVFASQIFIFAADDDTTLYLQIGNDTLTATLADNSAAKELKKLLAKDSITINMSDYGGFEKVGDLGINLPKSDTSITTKPGDLILYQGNQLVIFYGPNTWSYTRIGKINNVTQTELKNILGNKNVTVTLFSNDFGKVPKTGVPNLTIAIVTMVVFIIISTVLWVYILCRKLREYNHV